LGLEATTLQPSIVLDNSALTKLVDNFLYLL